MSTPAIRKALENHLAAMPNRLPTVWQGRATVAGFDANQPHQKAFLMPSPSQSKGLTEKTTLHSGIFQVNLCYPSERGALEAEAQGLAVAQYFRGRVLSIEGIKVRIRGNPTVGAPVTIAPLVVPVTIRYQSII